MNDDQFSFYPVVRDGLRPGSEFSQGKVSGDAGSTSVELTVEASGDGTTTENPGVDITIYGPGDVTNLDTDQVVRMEPEPDTAEFPPNYLPLVEFDEPAIPWQFSPERADEQGRNRPWLCLVAVPRDAVQFTPAGRRPLPVLETPASELPDAEDSWAWAHAQIVGKDTPEQTFGTGSTRTVSRLLCPRNLSAQTSYRACVVPTFEAGRRAGLGLEPYPDGRSSVSFAWTNEDTVRLPVYHTWTFSTAKKGDFESLARELTPTAVGDDVGFRTVDVSNPGPTDLKLAPDEATDTGTVGLGGALKSVSAAPDTYDDQMRGTLRNLLNDPNTVETVTDYGAVGPPIYGRFHAGVPALAHPDEDDEDFYFPQWLDTLNTDPRHRIVAGIGAQIVRNEQQRLVQSAWEQFGDLDIANEKLRRLRLAEKVSSKRYERMKQYPTGALLGLTSPIHGTVLDGDQTLLATASETDIPDALTSTAFRRLARPNGPLARRNSVSMDPSKLTTHIESGRIPRMTDGLAPTTEVRAVGETAGRQTDASGQESPSATGDQGGTTVQQSKQTQQSGSDTSTPSSAAETVLTALDGVRSHVESARSAVTALSNGLQRSDTATIKAQVEQRPTVLDRCQSIDRNTVDPLSRALSKLAAGTDPPISQSTANEHLGRLHSAQRALVDAVESATTLLGGDQPDHRRARQRLQKATTELDALDRVTNDIETAVSGGRDPTVDVEQVETVETVEDVDTEALQRPDPTPKTLDLPDLQSKRERLLEELNPTNRIHELAAAVTGIRGLRERDDPIEEVLAAPSFENPTARLLKEFDQEAFLPGVGDIPQNSISALQTNPTFVEAFMAGLNHELARELNWRNYPTDRRGTYFRRFWEKKGHPNRNSGDKEKLADIEPMHTWDENDLEDNSPGDDAAKVVLLIRGELLRRYPNTDIFAAKAAEENGDRMPALPKTNITRSDQGPDLKFPEFRGKLDPDITFFAFDLTPEEALYEPYTAASADDHHNEGWFFVLEEPPAETRFGMDIGDDVDPGSTPYGINSDASDTPRKTSRDKATEVEDGWSGLTWAHLNDAGDPSQETHVDVDDCRPWNENWRVEAGTTHVHDPVDEQEQTPFADDQTQFFDSEEAAEWGYNSAHMARVLWQRPVRISIHADDIIHEEATSNDRGGSR